MWGYPYCLVDFTLVVLWNKFCCLSIHGYFKFAYTVLNQNVVSKMFLSALICSICEHGGDDMNNYLFKFFNFSHILTLTYIFLFLLDIHRRVFLILVISLDNTVDAVIILYLKQQETTEVGLFAHTLVVLLST